MHAYSWSDSHYVRCFSWFSIAFYWGSFVATASESPALRSRETDLRNDFLLKCANAGDVLPRIESKSLSSDFFIDLSTDVAEFNTSFIKDLVPEDIYTIMKDVYFGNIRNIVISEVNF